MSEQKDAPGTNPPKKRPPESAGAIEPPSTKGDRQPRITQSMIVRQQAEELREIRGKFDAELHAWRLKCDEIGQRELNLTAANAALEATNRHLARDLQANGVALILAGTLATMGSALLSYLASDAGKLAALVTAAVGCSWGLVLGLMTFVKNEQDDVPARRAALLLFITVAILLFLHRREIARLALRLI